MLPPTIVSISFDRLLMVGFPIKHRILVQGKMTIWLVTIWIVSYGHLALKLLNSYYVVKAKKGAIHLMGRIGVSFSAVMYIFTYYKLKKTVKVHGFMHKIQLKVAHKR